MPESRKFNFFHGTSRDLAEVLPADVHGGEVAWPDMSRTSSAYATVNENDAWTWATEAMDRTGTGSPRVYEVEPEGLVVPDRNTTGGQFEIEKGKVLREISMPPNSQGRLVPDVHGDTFDRLPSSWERSVKQIEDIDRRWGDLIDEDTANRFREMDTLQSRLFAPQEPRVRLNEQPKFKALEAEREQAKASRDIAQRARLEQLQAEQKHDYEARRHFSDPENQTYVRGV